MNIGLMQGRLSKPVRGKIQAFPWSTWQQEFELLRDTGLKVLEWTLDYENLFQNPLLTSDGIKEIDVLSQEFDISINSVTCDNFMQAPVFKRPIQPRTTKSNLQQFFGLAPQQIKYWVWPLVDQGAPRNATEWNETITQLIELSPCLERTGSRILFETELNAQENRDLLQRFPAQFFGLNLDIGNTVAHGFDPLEEFKINELRIHNIHIKDRLINGPTVPLGHGDVDWLRLKKPLLDFSGNLILQCARTEIDELQQIKIYTSFVLDLLQEGAS
jgi:L-ribulose-5-phosphate 3-epimerase